MRFRAVFRRFAHILPTKKINVGKTIKHFCCIFGLFFSALSIDVQRRRRGVVAQPLLDRLDPCSALQQKCRVAPPQSVESEGYATLQGECCALVGEGALLDALAILPPADEVEVLLAAVSGMAFLDMAVFQLVDRVEGAVGLPVLGLSLPLFLQEPADIMADGDGPQALLRLRGVLHSVQDLSHDGERAGIQVDIAPAQCQDLVDSETRIPADVQWEQVRAADGKE